MSEYISVTNNGTKVIDDNTVHLRFTKEQTFNDSLTHDDYLDSTYDGLWFTTDADQKLVAVKGVGLAFHATNYFRKKGSTKLIADYDGALTWISGMNTGSLQGFDAHGLHYRPSSRRDNPTITGDASFLGKNINKNQTKIYTVEQGVGDTNSKSGMQIFNDKGEVIFDSKNKYTDIIDIIHFKNFETDFNKEYKYDVPIAIVPLDMSVYNSLHYGRGADNNSYVELVACYMNTEKSFKLVKMKKTGASGTTRSFSKDSFVTNQTLLLVLDATSIS